MAVVVSSGQKPQVRSIPAEQQLLRELARTVAVVVKAYFVLLLIANRQLPEFAADTVHFQDIPKINKTYKCSDKHYQRWHCL